MSARRTAIDQGYLKAEESGLIHKDGGILILFGSYDRSGVEAAHTRTETPSNITSNNQHNPNFQKFIPILQFTANSETPCQNQKS